MTTENRRKLALGAFLTMLFAMLVFAMLAGHLNRGLLVLSSAGRLVFCMGAAAGVVLCLYVLRLLADPLTGTVGWMELRRRGWSVWALRLVITFVAMSVIWSLAWFGFLQRAASFLDGPLHSESARLQRPLYAGPPAWCGYFTAVHVESGSTGSLCMERLGERSDFVPVLGCVPLDTRATIQITQTFLGPVGSLVEIIDDGGRCARKAGKG